MKSTSSLQLIRQVEPLLLLEYRCSSESGAAVSVVSGECGEW